MGNENLNNTDQDRQNQGGQNANQTQPGEKNFDRQQNQQGGTSGGQAGQTDPNRDRQSDNAGLDDDDTGTTGSDNPGQQR